MSDNWVDDILDGVAGAILIPAALPVAGLTLVGLPIYGGAKVVEGVNRHQVNKPFIQEIKANPDLQVTVNFQNISEADLKQIVSNSRYLTGYGTGGPENEQAVLDSLLSYLQSINGQTMTYKEFRQNLESHALKSIAPQIWGQVKNNNTTLQTTDMGNGIAITEINTPNEVTQTLTNAETGETVKFTLPKEPDREI